MKHIVSASRPTSPARGQHGLVSLGGALTIILMITAAVLSILSSTGSSLSNSSDNEKQVAALFLAESGLERAQASVAQAIADTGSYQNTTCTGLVTGQPVTMGRGSFLYDAAVSVPPACGTGGTACTACNVVVSGQVDTTRRRLQSQIQVAVNQGVQGHGSSFTLKMNAQRLGGAALTHLAYRATATLATDVSSNAQVGSCVNSGGACDLSNQGWDLQRTGTNNVSSMGVFAPVSASGDQTLTTTLVTNANTPAARNYAHTGVFFYPLTSPTAVNFKGLYAQPTGRDATAATSSTSGSLPNTWHCGGSTYATAAESDTLVYGFSSKPVSEGRQLDGVRLGVVPMKRLSNLTGVEGDFLYTQIWFTWNPAYSTTAKASGSGTTLTLSPTPTALPAVGTTLGIAGGAGAFDTVDFTGSINGNVLTVSAISSGTVQPGDALFGRHLTPGVRVVSRLSGTGAAGSTYSVCSLTSTNSCAAQQAAEGPITARVGVVSAPTSSTLVVSRAPRTALSGASLCGGVCALLFGASGASTRNYDLSNITSGDDWASGFVCLSGVDPSSAQVLGSTSLRRTFWTEPIQ